MEQIELDLVHNWLDQQQKNGNPEFFIDESYEDYDKETEEQDKVLSDHSVPVHKKTVQPAITVPVEPSQGYGEGDWEDVE
jgi:hypothetical protein